MVKKLALLFFLFLTITLIFLFPKTKNASVFTKEAIFGDFDLKGVSEEAGNRILNNTTTKPIYLNLESQSQAVTLEDMGITIDSTQVRQFTMKCYFKSFHYFCDKLSTSEIKPESILKIDQEKLDEFTSNLEKELQFIAKNNIVSLEENTFRAVSPNAKVLLDKSKFTDPKNILELFSNDTISLNIELEVEDTTSQNKITQELINRITTPLLIKHGRNPFYIPTNKLKDFIKVNEVDRVLYGSIDENKVGDYLNELNEEYKVDGVNVLKQEAIWAIQRALLFRATDYEINNAVILPIEGEPKSNGELHDTYLEVIKSQQRLYRFEDGKLVKTYIVSTGLTWETPPGEFTVLGKQAMTISYFNDWYMPHYLPLGTINGYRFGFHAIPYHLDGQGNIYSRDINTMGSPATGGCIQLTPDDAKELFEWAKVGLPVYIYQ